MNDLEELLIPTGFAIATILVYILGGWLLVLAWLGLNAGILGGLIWLDFKTKEEK